MWHLYQRKELTLRKATQTVGAILVVAGVAGEMLFQELASTTDTKLRSASSQRIASLKSSAANYQHELKLAELQIEEAKSNAELARKETSLAQKSIAMMNLEAEKARQLAEGEHLERVRLETSIQPRRLSEPQRRNLRSVLARSSKTIVVVGASYFDAEAIALAEDLASVLRESDWNVSVNKSFLTDRTGITIYSQSKGDGYEALRKALSSAGIVCTESSTPRPGSISNGYQPEITYLLIHHKQYGKWSR
jgi:hypothetical protein